MKLPMPTLGQQRYAMTVCNRLEATQNDKALIPTELNALLPAILDRAFRGEL